MSDHKLTLKTGGRMEMGWIQPVCTCGWEGRKEYAYNDYQHSNVREQEGEHIQKMRAQS